MLVIAGLVLACRVRGHRRRRRDRGGVRRAHEEPLPQRRHGRRHDSLGEALVVNERDVEDAQARLAAGGVEVLAARLDREDLRPADALGDIAAGVLVRVFQLASSLKVLAEIVGISKLVQRAADDGLRLIALGDNDRSKAMVASGDPAVASDEIDVVRALHQKLGDDRVIVAVLREMTVGARLGVGVARTDTHPGSVRRPFWAFSGCFGVVGRPAGRRERYAAR